MADPRGNAPRLVKGQKIREGIKVAKKVCNLCGVEKPVSRFHKRHGYEQYKNNDPRRYDTQCKLCKKPTKPGQDRSELTEPVNPNMRRAQKLIWKKKRAHERKNKPKLSQAQYKQKVREETRVKSMLYLASKGCEECGERDPRVLEYDHKDPRKKRATISKLVIDGYSWKSPVLKAEVAKCRVLCANCHRRHTVSQQNHFDKRRIQEVIGKLAARYKFDL